MTLSKTLSDTLTEECYQNDVDENLCDAKYYLDIRNYDLVLLAWPATSEKSLDIISTIKTEAHKTSVIVLSEREDKESEIKALRSGADDFIRKPLDTDVLLVRIEAKLRFGISNIIEIEYLIINPEEEKITTKFGKNWKESNPYLSDLVGFNPGGNGLLSTFLFQGPAALDSVRHSMGRENGVCLDGSP